jgi:hypothetical protein
MSTDFENGLGGLYQRRPQDEGSGSRPLIIAAALIVVVGVLIWLYARTNKPQASGPAAEAPYASSLRVSDLHLSTAKNFVGGEVTYLEGKIANQGSKSLTAAQVQCIFRNSLGEVVDQPVVPLQVLATNLGNPDFVSLGQAPLAPNQQREFRLTFEHVSADWNMGFPELRVISAGTK